MTLHPINTKAKEPGTDLVPQITFGSGTVVSRAGMKLADELTFEQWLVALKGTIEFQDGLAFAVGDALIYGQFRFGERYVKVLEELELKYDRVRDWVYVAGNVPQSLRRVPELGFYHHRAVAKLVPDEQEVWLTRAVLESMSVRQLREEIAGRPAASPSAAGRPALPPAPIDVSPTGETLAAVTLTTDADRIQRWYDAAELLELDVCTWAMQTLDAAAG